MKLIDKAESVVFNSLLIAALLYDEFGGNLWPENMNPKKKAGISEIVNFGKFMMFWRFKERFVPHVMADDAVSGEDD